MYTVLARRYRSQKFEEVIGQGAIARTLTNAIKTDRVAHAYLFTGPRGVGKTTMARILAKALNCLKAEGPTSQPCCECESCVAINTGDDIDVIEIDGASNTSVDDVRELRENAIYRPARARFKIYIIDEVHMLSPSAFNALLKILEEPPTHIKFIFATTQPNKVLLTVQSRCQRFDFKNISSSEIAEQLRYILKTEEIDFEDELVVAVARLANGSMRDALSLLDQLISTGIAPLTFSMLEEFLGQPDVAKIHNLIEKIAGGDASQSLAAIDDLLVGGQSAVQIVVSAIDYMRDLMILKCDADATELLVVMPDGSQDACRLAEKFDMPGLIYGITMLEKLCWAVRNTDNPRALLEAAMLRLTLSEHFLDVTELLSQLKGQPTQGPGKLKKNSPEPVNKAASRTSQIAKGTLRIDSPRQAKSITPGKLNLPYVKGNWQTILKEIESDAANIAVKLVNAVPQSFGDDGTLTLAFPPNAAMAKALCENGSTAPQIQSLLSQILGSPVKVRFTIGKVESNGEANTTKPRKTGRLSQKEVNEIISDPAVKTLLTDLDASVTDVRPP
jgi:DNA polymerase-3 subunit gamma/tau